MVRTVLYELAGFRKNYRQLTYLPTMQCGAQASHQRELTRYQLGDRNGSRFLRESVLSAFEWLPLFIQLQWIAVRTNLTFCVPFATCKLQNPVYYEFMLERNFATKPVADITKHIVERSHRRYNLDTELPAVTEAWTLLVNSSYAQDLSVQDGTGVPHLGNAESWAFEADKHTPSAVMCQVYTAWSKLIDASATIKTAEPFRYDLVNTGREVLAQLAGPAGKNFTAAIGGEALDAAAVKKTGEFYAQVLTDVDELVATDTAFQIGPWIEMAKAFANMNGTAGVEDCTEGVGADKWPTITSCVKFYEWNARTQLTTWNPTPKGGAIPSGPVDYASKHWCACRPVQYYLDLPSLLPPRCGAAVLPCPTLLVAMPSGASLSAAGRRAQERPDPRLLRGAREAGDGPGAGGRCRGQTAGQRSGDHD
jgi:hypothetical protein|eukprot:COSAG06_NODE_4773_length_3964_cov_2.352393_5_plen_422_part_00